VNALGVSYPTRAATRPVTSPAASMGSDAWSRSSVRQRPKGNPAPVTNPLARVRSLAPTRRPQSARVRRSAGSRRSPAATCRAGSPAGMASEIVFTGTGVSRSASSASACARRAASRSVPRYPISSASSGLAAMTTGVVQPAVTATAASGRT